MASAYLKYEVITVYLKFKYLRRFEINSAKMIRRIVVNCPLQVAMSKLSIVSNGTAGDYSLIQQMAPTFRENNKRKNGKVAAISRRECQRIRAVFVTRSETALDKN